MRITPKGLALILLQFFVKIEKPVK
jgi:hypothetical protein